MATAFLNLVEVTFGHDGGRPLLAGVAMTLDKGERLALVGRNGSGKSTLLKLLAGMLSPDGGEIHRMPAMRAAYLSQSPDAAGFATAGDYVTAEVPEPHLVARALAEAEIEAGRAPESLSGGALKRLALARAFARRPDLLLLDEPTNHLDLPAILWLEGRLANFAGGIILVSHDRALLERVATASLWLDRGRLRRHAGRFAAFEAWMETVLAEEADARDKLDKRIREETRWSHEGITARRRRNQGRLRRLAEMRRERRDSLSQIETARMRAPDAPLSGKLVIEAKGLAKAYGGTPVIAEASMRIMRGDQIAILGPNGAGKTTLVRMLTGELAPDAGTVRHGANLSVQYLDQHRGFEDESLTPAEVIRRHGGEHIEIGGGRRHVAGYLRDFLFDGAQIESPVSSLSGGERNRLLLARAFARPANLLVLDEPTNDLDMETLEVLREILAEWPATVLLVSHDRAFVDAVATATLVLEGDGRVTEYAGGYSDYMAQRGERPAAEAVKPAKPRKAPRPRAAAQPARLDYARQRRLDMLPALIETRMGEIAAAQAVLDQPDLYSRDLNRFNATTEALARLEAERAAMEEEWLELEMLREEREGTIL